MPTAKSPRDAGNFGSARLLVPLTRALARSNVIKEGKGAMKWTRLSCRTFAGNSVRLQLHALAYNLGNFMRTLAMPGRWSRGH
jgi:hypothetical protein